MSERMTDERLAEVLKCDYTSGDQVPELKSALKAERAFLLGKLDMYLAMEAKLADIAELSEKWKTEELTAATEFRTLGRTWDNYDAVRDGEDCADELQAKLKGE